MIQNHWINIIQVVNNGNEIKQADRVYALVEVRKFAVLLCSEGEHVYVYTIYSSDLTKIYEQLLGLADDKLELKMVGLFYDNMVKDVYDWT